MHTSIITNVNKRGAPPHRRYRGIHRITKGVYPDIWVCPDVGVDHNIGVYHDVGVDTDIGIAGIRPAAEYRKSTPEPAQRLDVEN